MKHAGFWFLFAACALNVATIVRQRRELIVLREQLRDVNVRRQRCEEAARAAMSAKETP